ncbi:uncharacterized protein EAF01_007082 [Botrytis porri]|uniref:Uncharacterized protein n=1 Tax=Botrytis porri TaxID=87229 RepID=A0A4Z1KXJ2_9HELO|nr:uncharacterized protein EAF01_007082 [Botrytis porri]KAF7901783.1 hypothetical protein EAF01_007082 [Botrytis porri]TGO89297.1 hypothetical protein BPOR_0115g00020 [Botrytis porri]
MKAVVAEGDIEFVRFFLGTEQVKDRKMDSGEMDRGPLESPRVLDDEASLDSQSCEDDRRNERSHSIAKEYKNLAAQKAEFKKLPEDNRGKSMNSKTRVEQYKFNTAIKAFNKRLEKAREARKVFNKKSETLRGKLLMARERKKSFLQDYKYKQTCLAERELRLDAKLSIVDSY